MNHNWSQEATIINYKISHSAEAIVKFKTIELTYLHVFHLNGAAL